MTRIQLVLVVVPLLGPGLMAGQSLVSLPVGAHVRVTASAQQLDHAPAQLLERRGDSLALQLDSANDSRVVAIPNIQQLEVQQGWDRMAGLALGDLLGLVAGGVIGEATGSGNTDRSWGPSSRDMSVLESAAIGAVAGMVVGYLWLAPEKWVKTALPAAATGAP